MYALAPYPEFHLSKSKSCLGAVHHEVTQEPTSWHRPLGPLQAIIPTAARRELRRAIIVTETPLARHFLSNEAGALLVYISQKFCTRID